MVGPFVATTFTAVLGSNLEVHGDAALAAGTETLALPDGAGTLALADRRRAAFLVGAKLSLPWRISAIVELNTTDGLLPLGGASGATLTSSPLGTSPTTTASPSLSTERRHYAFLHIGKSRLRERPHWRDWDVGAVLLLGLSDGGRMLILDLERRVGQRFALHGRLSVPGGSAATSEYGMIPWTSMASVSLRYQM